MSWTKVTDTTVGWDEYSATGVDFLLDEDGSFLIQDSTGANEDKIILEEFGSVSDDWTKITDNSASWAQV